MCSEFKHTIFCALSLNHLWAEIEKMHKISGQDYNIVTSTLVRNYNIIIHKILYSSQILYSKFKYTIFYVLSLNHLWAEIEKCIKFSDQNYDIVISTLVKNYNIIIHKILYSSQSSIFLCINYPVGSN